MTLVDNNPSLYGTFIEGIPCQSIDEIRDGSMVVIMVDNEEAREDISGRCVDKGLEVCFYNDLLKVIYPIYEKNVLRKMQI